MTLRPFLAPIVLAACGGGGGDVTAPDAPVIPAPVGQFPEGFLWGTAIAPYQVEGNLHDTDGYVEDCLRTGL